MVATPRSWKVEETPSVHPPVCLKVTSRLTAAQCHSHNTDGAVLAVKLLVPLSPVCEAALYWDTCRAVVSVTTNIDGKSVYWAPHLSSLLM